MNSGMTPDSHTDADFLPRGSEPALSPDFQAGVFEKIRRHHRRRQAAVNVGVFSVMLTVSLVLRQNRLPPEIPAPLGGRAASAARGVDWLVESQTADGGWRTETWSGHPGFADGVSALATLALLNAPEPVDTEVMSKAVSALERSLIRQQERVLDGPQFYNLILTLNTLTEVQKHMPRPDRQLLLRKTYANLLRYQQPDGGWGYPDRQPMGYSGESQANSAVTWWMCHLLEQRPPLELPEADRALARGKNWLAQRRLPDGGIRYREDSGPVAGPENALYWMAALLTTQRPVPPVSDQDAYRDYFRITVSGGPSEIKRLQEQQQQNGSWENPGDRWWRAGGKVYLTALSVLSQVPRGA